MISPATDPVGIDIVEDLVSLGFDYIELSLRDLAALPEAQLVRLIERLHRTGIACEACNNFFPPEVRLTGPSADLPVATHYARRALTAAARTGVKVAIFGSSGARNVPEGFSREAAWSQLRVLLSALGPIAEQLGITIGIEHLNRGESNILTSVAEGWRMQQEVAHPRVRLLIDAYHMRQENEDPAILALVAPLIEHVHIAQDAERLFPHGNDHQLTAFFAALNRTGYASRCSIEAYTRDFLTDAARGLRICRDLVSGTAT